MNGIFGPTIELGFSKRSDGPMNLVGHEFFDGERRANRAQFLSRQFNLKPDQAVYPKVFHGAVAEIVDQHNPVWEALKCDAVITGKRGLALTMPAADCPTIFLFDPTTDVIALIHAGWRPLAAGVIKRTFDKMRIGLNVSAANVLAYIGPGICIDHYEVGPEVAKRFGWQVQGKVQLNLFTEIEKLLSAEGVRIHNITHSNECTFHQDDGEKYYSWRREKSNPLNAQMAVLLIK